MISTGILFVLYSKLSGNRGQIVLMWRLRNSTHDQAWRRCGPGPCCGGSRGGSGRCAWGCATSPSWRGWTRSTRGSTGTSARWWQTCPTHTGTQTRPSEDDLSAPRCSIAIQYFVFPRYNGHPLLVVDIAITNPTFKSFMEYSHAQSLFLKVLLTENSWELEHFVLTSCTLLRKRSELIFIPATAATLLW